MHNIFPNKTASILIVFLILLNIVSWSAFSSRGKELEKIRATVPSIEHGQKVLAFQKLFVDKILGTEGTVDYETRLALEQAVGKTDDDAVIAAWNSFIAVKTESEGQNKVIELLSVLADSALK